MIPQALLHDAATLLDACRARRVKLATAESCTGGLIAAVLTAIAGPSDVVERASSSTRTRSEDGTSWRAGRTDQHARCDQRPGRGAHGQGALQRSLADIVVSVTGLAGSGGGSVEKPVGLAWFGLAQRGRATVAGRQDISR